MYAGPVNSAVARLNNVINRIPGNKPLYTVTDPTKADPRLAAMTVTPDGGEPTEIGPGATIGHLCMVHSAKIGEEALIANGAVVLDGAVIGDRSLIGAGATVTPNTVIPGGVMAFGSPAIVRGPVSESAMKYVRSNPSGYRELARRYAAGLLEIDRKD